MYIKGPEKMYFNNIILFNQLQVIKFVPIKKAGGKGWIVRACKAQAFVY